MHFRAKASFCKGFALGFHLHILFLENICPLDLSAAENAALSLLNFYVVSLVKLFVGTLTSNNEKILFFILFCFIIITSPFMSI